MPSKELGKLIELLRSMPQGQGMNIAQMRSNMENMALLQFMAYIDPMVKSEGAAEMARLYLGNEDPRSPLASPLYGDLSGLPPTLVQVGTAEVLMDDSVRLVNKAKKSGVNVTYNPWPDMIHVWHAFADILPEAREAIKAIGKYVSHHTG